MSNLDHLLYLVGVLGADAAWLLRGSDSASLVYELDEDEPIDLEISQEIGPVVFVACFPDDLGDAGLTEMRLPAGASDREIQAAALLSAAFDNLTKIGPHTTIRVLKWVFERYGIKPDAYDSLWQVRDRRPKADTLDPAPDPPPAPPATAETTRLETAPPDDPRSIRGQQLRAQRVALGLSETDLARAVGLDARSRPIQRIERGAKEPNAALWEQIQAAIERIRKEREHPTTTAEEAEEQARRAMQIARRAADLGSES